MVLFWRVFYLLFLWGFLFGLVYCCFLGDCSVLFFKATIHQPLIQVDLEKEYVNPLLLTFPFFKINIKLNFSLLQRERVKEQWPK